MYKILSLYYTICMQDGIYCLTFVRKPRKIAGIIRGSPKVNLSSESFIFKSNWTVHMQFYDWHFTFQHGPHHNCSTSITESAFQFPSDRSLCPSFANTLSQMSSHHHHFEIWSCQDDPVQQAVAWCQIRAVCWIFQDFPPEVLQGVVKSYWHCVTKQRHAEAKHLS